MEKLKFKMPYNKVSAHLFLIINQMMMANRDASLLAQM